jgi:hypothetical protein
MAAAWVIFKILMSVLEQDKSSCTYGQTGNKINEKSHLNSAIFYMHPNTWLVLDWLKFWF